MKYPENIIMVCIKHDCELYENGKCKGSHLWKERCMIKQRAIERFSKSKQLPNDYHKTNLIIDNVEKHQDRMMKLRDSDMDNMNVSETIEVLEGMKERSTSWIEYCKLHNAEDFTPITSLEIKALDAAIKFMQRGLTPQFILNVPGLPKGEMQTRYERAYHMRPFGANVEPTEAAKAFIKNVCTDTEPTENDKHNTEPDFSDWLWGVIKKTFDKRIRFLLIIGTILLLIGVLIEALG